MVIARLIGLQREQIAVLKAFGYSRREISWHYIKFVLMLVFLIGGLFMTTRIKQEIHPEFELDLVTVTVDYPGASPEEVEKAILLSIESEVRGIDGVNPGIDQHSAADIDIVDPD